MKKFNCPSCGADVIFQSNVSVYSVCAFCSSMIVRHDINVESIGKMAMLPNDMSPLMLGTEGIYHGLRFRIIGRMKIGWKDGTWNEWYTVSENGGRGWLAEAQGFYALSYEQEEGLPAEAKKSLDKFLNANKSKDENFNRTDTWLDSVREDMLGSHLFLNQLKYKIVDIKSAICLGSEGELPFIAPKGRKILSIDLLGHQGEFANIEIDKDKNRLYLGNYMEWNDFHFQNLRPLENW